MNDVEKNNATGLNTRNQHNTGTGVGGPSAGGLNNSGNYNNSSQGYRPLANPGPLGLLAFASTLFIMSLYTVHARHILVPDLIIGMALFCGGLAQLLAGMWEFAHANTFSATVFTMYGAFWLSLAIILIPGTGIISAYSSAGSNMFSDAIGIFLITWMLVSFLFFIAAMRRTIGQTVFFGFLTLTFMLSGIGAMRHSSGTSKAGGWLGIITALIAFYLGLSELLTANDLFTLPTGSLRRRDL
ncbi:hypothetical protein FA95DRAFT_1558435 [Auriscalpium vulgare]|uniref:Uncharacterized protein n=1 Tax=Auriscalpium vulgare TaxID=40419 RepID=A0ACB8RV59_9AGAM|nr:hypothetical protein FA95DRAFT_1558435 [Auriscalpium vulgare]